MNEYLDSLYLTLTSPRKRAPGTISSYMSTARIFLTWLEDRLPPTDKDLRRFFLYREEKGISPRTRSTEFVQLKKLCEANDWSWPFKPEDRPVAEDEPFAPAFTLEEVLTIIAARENYSPQENFYVAVSTIYGTRREEIGRIVKRDIQVHDGSGVGVIPFSTLSIKTAKKGQKRTQLIPEEVMPFIESWRPRERGVRAISYSFQRVMEKSGLGKRPGWGFHSIRRTLLTLLSISLAKNDYPPALAAEYLRWSKKSIGMIFMGSAMAGIYTHPEVLSDDPYHLDRIIQSESIHPFLAAYRQAPDLPIAPIS